MSEIVKSRKKRHALSDVFGESLELWISGMGMIDLPVRATRRVGREVLALVQNPVTGKFATACINSLGRPEVKNASLTANELASWFIGHEEE